MTQSSTLIRPVLLTKNTSRAYPSAVADVSSGARVATAMKARASPSLYPSLSPDHLYDTKGGSDGEASMSPGTATVQSPYLSRPSPLPPSSQPVGHRRSRRLSLISLNSNSSTSFLHHEQRRSQDERAAGTLRVFNAMPDLSPATKEANGERCCCSADEDLTLGTSGSAPDGVGNIPFTMQVGGAEAAATAVCGARQRGTGVSGAGAHSHDAVNYADPLPSTCAGSDLLHKAGLSGIVVRLKERGNTFLLCEEFELAIATYTEAIRLAPGHEALWGNRACALLLSFRYLPAVADCLYLLHLRPGHTKAYWRAAKAYAATYRLLEAKKFYQLAQQACTRGGVWRGSASISGTAAPSSSMRTSKDDDGTPDTVPTRGAAESTAAEAVGAFCRPGSHFLKAQRDREAMAAEAAALEMVETYWQHLRHERWADALGAMDKVLALPSYTGPTAVSWQALRLEALLHLQPKKALAEAETLYRAYPNSLELYPVLAKAIFYDAHDAAATTRCLSLLDEAAEKRRVQNCLLKAHVSYSVKQLRGGLPADTGKTTALHMETWGKQHCLREDSRTTELRHTIEKFARHRDAGNAAYAVGDWEAAASAYTRCLETDRLNHALLAAVHCNRTAVYMQAGRWQDALSDADAAVSLSPEYATAYARRGRVQLYLLAQEYGGQRATLANRYAAPWVAAMKERLQGYADAAVMDLTRAVELSPTMEHKAQLQQALTQRQAIQALLKSPSETSKASMPSSSAASSEKKRHRGQSAHSSPPPSGARHVESMAIHELVEQLKLLGLSIVAPSAPGEFGRLPEPKVIAKAYRELALRWHPDKWVTATPHEQQRAEQQFKSICVAYQALREHSGALF
ncbi:TPR-repeat-containing chaperone protein DNAJ, putative [Leishmania panamensis]|uniref:TPR-repeat-containing chaperone protein DNAJ, putative n=1 Tax=Leishmania panamensis TaxID=5679 RepID=A0A088S200_LEIPA|nr:TPR-repeat-containing chaperone protein DNAJ, putative [Leishmania panamensis]AIO02216.1 TPR-repeat-containing chaperone protein DNAJ, putative [Leishmania panamensis]